MTGNTPVPSRVLGRRAAQLALIGAVAATPLAFSTGIASATDWDAIAQCESSGNWSTSTGNGFSGGLQFTPSTWKAFGGSGSAEDASRSQQIQVAERVKSAQGMNAWPTCSKKTGETSNASNSGSGSDSGSGSGSTSHKAEKSSTKSTGSTAKVEDASASRGDGDYVVKSGDTLSRIVRTQNVSGGVAGLAERNGISDPDKISVGQKLSLA